MISIWKLYIPRVDNLLMVHFQHSQQYSLSHNACRFIQQSKIDVIFTQLNAYITLAKMRLRQNGRHFPDDIFKCIFLNENVSISIKISLKFVPKGSIGNTPTLVHITAWHQPGDKLLSVPMMVRLLTHICVTRPQWVNVHIIAFIKVK